MSDTDTGGGGGGASKSTDPASGSSAATDVSLREHLESQVRALDRLYKAELAALKELIQEKHAAAQEAVKLALSSQKELAEKHNDLIRTGEKKDITYATKDDLKRVETWQARLTGGMIVVGVIGVTNLVKVWLSP